MSNSQTTPCSKCGTAIPFEDLKQGLAVKVNNEAICHVCVDAGFDEAPTAAPIARPPLMQQNIYRFTHHDHEELNRFTFLTAGHIALHRRITREQGEFEPPELRRDDETKRLTAIAKNKTTRRESHSRDPEKFKAIKAIKTSHKNKPLFIGLAALVTVAVLLSIILSSNGDQETKQQTAQVVDQQVKTRNDFPDDPFTAWPLAMQDSPANDTLLATLADEMIFISAKRLQRAQDAINQNDSVAAFEQLKLVVLPEHPLFNDINHHKQQLSDQRNGLIAGTGETNPETTEPNNTPDPETVDPQVALQALEYRPLLQLTTELDSNGNIGHALDTKLAATYNCSNTSIGDREAIQFNEGGYIEVANPLSYPHSFFINFWFRTEPNISSMPMWLYSHGQQNTAGSVNIYLNDAETLRTVIAYNDLNDLNVTLQMTDGKWHNYALMVDPVNGARVFVDGKLLAQKNGILGPLNPKLPLILGADYEKKNSLRGALAKYRCYQGVLESEKFTQSYTEIASVLFPPEAKFVYVKIETPNQIIKNQAKLPDATNPAAWTTQKISALKSTPFKCMNAADLDQDGDLDLILGTATGTKVSFNDGSGNFNPAVSVHSSSKKDILALACADLNNDGYIDVIEAPSNAALQIFINDKTGNFVKSSTEFYDPLTVKSIQVADLNNDQRPDFVVSTKGKNHLVYICNGNLGENFKWLQTPLLQTDGTEDILIIDINNDQFLDILEASKTEGILLHKNNGDNTFASAQNLDPNLSACGGKLGSFKRGAATHLISTDGNGKLLSYEVNKNGTITREEDLTDITEPVRKFLGIDLNSDNNDEFIFVDKKNMLTIMNHEKQSAALKAIEHGVHRFQINDFTGNGYLDILAYSSTFKDFDCSLVIRNLQIDSANTTNNTDTDSQTTTNTSTTQKPRTAPEPVIVSQFNTKQRYKSVNVYDDYIEANNYPPQLNGVIRNSNFPEALSGKAAGNRTSEIELILSNNAKNGGILITLLPGDERREKLSVVLTDQHGIQSDPIIINLSPGVWQTHSIDMSKVKAEFDSSQITGMHITDIDSVSSLNFYLYRLCFFSDFVPNVDDLPVAKQLILNTDVKTMVSRFDTKKIKRGNLADTLFVLDKELYEKDLTTDLQAALEPVLGSNISSKQFIEFVVDERWIENVLDKSYLKKLKPSYVIFIGVGNPSQSNSQSLESVTFWQNVASQCLQRNALPIFCLGPNIGHNNKSETLWNELCGDQFLGHNIYKTFPLIDMRYPYMKAGNFNRGDRLLATSELARSIHDILARLQDLPK